MTHLSNNEFTPLPLPPGLEEDYIDCTTTCGLKYHIIKSGTPGRPLILFCHGYPELAFSWRKILPSIASQGDHYCIAMDQRGYGRTTGWAKDTANYSDTDLSQYTMTNLVRDLICLVYALGYRSVHCIIGHDFGAVSSAMAALMRPDIFHSTIQMSHPYHAPPSPPFGSEEVREKLDIQTELAKLHPPRKHYKWYNSTPTAAADWDNPAQGLEAFLHGYFHLKSGDWENNNPHPLKTWTAEALSEMPEYYIMQQSHTMPETVAANMKDQDPSKTHPWLSPSDLRIYTREWTRTGFQGALTWYRAQTTSTPQSAKDLYLYAGARLTVPCTFISGSNDWGNYQQPGALEGYTDENVVKPGCFRGVKMIEGAGHWVQQEKAERVVEAVMEFLGTLEGEESGQSFPLKQPS